jgi:asparagine synthase (glutamine-hydrolysing)
MCGIIAVLGHDHQEFGRGLDAIAHRGPDGRGALDLGWCRLGHVRLSIIDTEGGRQPISNEDGSVHVTFNGEIYNYIELRLELVQLGHTFRTASDTEVIVHAYEQWGEECAQRFRGMFAFVIADDRSRTVFVARDRFGIKPLVMASLSGTTIIASELPAIEAIATSPLGIEAEAIHAFLRLGYIPAPMTIFQGVQKVHPATCLLLNEHGVIRSHSTYWRHEFRPVTNCSEAEWLDCVDSTLREAVRIHLRSDVDFGAFLSGGLDSSLIVSYMSELMERPVKTFTIAFDEPRFSENQYAEVAAKRYQCDHRVLTVTRESLADLDQIVRRYGEPFADHSALPTLRVCEFAARNVKMVLSGDGGDELFGGYERYIQAAPFFSQKSTKGALQRIGREFLRRVSERRGSQAQYVPPIQHWKNNSRMFAFEELGDLLLRPPKSDPIDRIICRSLPATEHLSYLNAIQSLDVECYLPGDILTKVDIASMAYGLEVRVPFLDHVVAECAGQLPEEMLIRRSHDRKYVGKYVLKKLAERRFPHNFVYRAKKGFGIPIVQWVGGIPLPLLREKLLCHHSPLHAYLNQGAIASLIDDLSVPMRSRKLWLLLVLTSWLEQRKRPHSDRYV